MDEKKVIANNIGWKMAERVVALIISFATTAVLARLLDADSYGLLAIINVIVTMTMVFVTNGVGNSLIQKEEISEEDYSTMFWSNLAVSLILYGLIFVIAPYVASYYGYPELKSMLRVLALQIIIAAINSIQIAKISRRMEFKNYFYSTLTGKIVSGFLGIGLALYGMGTWALVIQSLSLMGTETIVLWFRGGFRPRLIYDKNRAKEFYSFAIKVSLSSFIVQLNDQVRNLVIGKKFSSSDLGYYDKGLLLPNTIVTNVMAALAAVMFPALSKEQSQAEKVKEMMSRWIGMTAFGLLPVAVGMAAVSENLVIFFFSAKWLPAAPFLSIACVVYATRIVELPIRENLKALGHADVFLRMQLVKTSLSIGGIFIFMKWGIMSIVLAYMACSLINIVISMWSAKKYIDFSVRDLYQELKGPALYSLAMYIVVFAVGKMSLNIYLELAMQVVLGIIIYVSLARLFKDRYYNLFLNLIKERIKK